MRLADQAGRAELQPRYAVTNTITEPTSGPGVSTPGPRLFGPEYIDAPKDSVSHYAEIFTARSYGEFATAWAAASLANSHRQMATDANIALTTVNHAEYPHQRLSVAIVKNCHIANRANF